MLVEIGWQKTKSNIDQAIEKVTFRRVSDMATAIHEGHTDKAIRFMNPTNGAEEIAAVTPAVVRIRPCEKYKWVDKFQGDNFNLKELKRNTYIP